ncbi:hypothetical protein AWN68_11465 [Roseivirga echinicomitans]|uniref:Uncharacterized protein n=2 Tax=Roseivirga echinicomitans TaxID=296218 RepID=A0A150X0X1_9BACT|nr:hypothetical protein AWN68_11465 [Roseivirga echinicomitans]
MLVCLAQLQAQQIKIGIISDFEQSPKLNAIIDQVMFEIDQTTGPSRKVSLKDTSFGIGSIESAQRAYTQFEGQIDLVVAIGSISTKGLASISDLSIPVVALGIIDPKLQDIPYVNGTSGKPNFTYIWQTRKLEEELEAFHKIHDFNSVLVFVDEKAASTINGQKARNFIDSLSKKFNTELSIVPVGANVEEVVNQLPPQTDAAYFTVLLSQTESQAQLMIDQLNERKIPTFSGNARLMDYGVLGSMANENDLQQVIRKLAIMSDEIAAGADLSSIPVTLNTKDNLYVNVATAQKIRLPIPFEVLFTARLIGGNDRTVKTYSFEEVAEKALNANLNIKISYQDVELSKAQVKSVKANLLPSVESSLVASQINEERANAAFNNPEQALTAKLTFNQLLYSERAIAALKIAEYAQKAQEYKTEAEVLKVLFDTYKAYLNVLSAKTNVLIQKQNLSNTRKNKELAEIRVNLGTSNNTDIYRWESELAIANQSVIDAQTKMLTAKLQLNTLLANSLESDFEIEDLSLEGDLYKAFSQSPITEVVKTPETLKLVSDFLVAESQVRNPNEKAILESINAADRQLTQSKRMLYTPTIALQAQTSQIVGSSGVGSSIDAGAMALGITELQKNSWFAGISLSLPIFSGFSRKAAIQQSKINLYQLDHSQTLLDQQLELGVRASVLDLLSSKTNIRYSKSASESAQKNFELVQENYKQGQASITQLIDAQQSGLQASLASAFSIYEYIQAHLQIEFYVGSFIMLMPSNQVLDFNNRLQQYLNN